MGLSTERQRRVRELFDAALDQPAPGRQEFVIAACDGDRQLEDTVTRLLAAHERSVGILDTPIRERREEAAIRIPAGSQIGPYKIIGERGGGGMGIVYQAVRADEVFQRVCAIKVIRPDVSSQHLLQQFRQERQVLARLDHVNIARIVDGGSTPEGLPYFVMDYVDGPSISAYCLQHGFSARGRLALFQQVCAAVQYLHQSGVIHGDLKPPNMLVGNDGLVRLVDFGIASILSSQSDSEKSQPLMMTRGYASPEQMAGQPLGSVSDVFSLGVVLYELLSGKRPYDLAGLGQTEALNFMRTQKVVPPSVAVLEGDANPTTVHGRPGLTRELDSIVLRAMQFEPARRYQSAAEMSAEIDRYLQGRPVNAHQQSLLYVSRKFLARHRSGIFASLLFVALLGIASLEAVQLRQMKATSGVKQGAVQIDQTTAVKNQEQVQKLQETIDRLNQALAKQQGHGSARNPADESKLRQLKLQQADLQQRQWQDFGKLAEAYRTSFSESVRLWPGMTPERRSLLQQAENYLRHAEPAAQDPRAREQLARAWLYLANIQGNPQTPNLHDHAGAIASINQAKRLLHETPDASSQLQQQVQAAAQQIEAAR